ncbi:hypothetical protein HGA64_04060 [Candidatus Falkowbacteria bacterium]|nr:hypothetical protein [Candidatus Falkowbacteria bacterium]
MDDKKAAQILIKLLEKDLLNEEEREAVQSAIGIFSWTSLNKSRLERKKEKIKKSAEWA